MSRVTADGSLQFRVIDTPRDAVARPSGSLSDSGESGSESRASHGARAATDGH